MRASFSYSSTLTLCLLIQVLCVSIVIDCFSYAQQPSCYGKERSILLRFKKSFIIDKSVLCSPTTYSPIESWKSENRNCCSWDGVECDQKSGHVIGLSLSKNCLYGFMDSNSSLFGLAFLHKLDLSGNNFNYSQIPTALGQLSNLEYLDLSNSLFSGPIPKEISKLSKLSVLNLALNYGQIFEESLLTLQDLSLECLFKNLTRLEELKLTGVKISSQFPESIANISSLQVIYMRNCGLQGKFPNRIFEMKNLHRLSVRWNPHLSGNLFQFNSSSSLEELLLGHTQFSGYIPSSIGNLASLNWLNLESCNFSGSIPTSIANLSQVSKLELEQNNWGGTFDMGILLKPKNLVALSLSGLNLTVLTRIGFKNKTDLAQLQVLKMQYCNLVELPEFLNYQDELQSVDLCANNIHGLIPKWVMNTSVETLQVLLLGGNLLTGFEAAQANLPWVSLASLDLSHNSLQGSLPVPPSELNSRGSSIFCNLTSLKDLDLSFNYMAGVLPLCLGNFSGSLRVLRVEHNLLHGSIPDTFASESCKLELAYFNDNRFQGKLPRSLVNCSGLKLLDISNNHVNDVFPSWLGTLKELRALILRSNQFHGVIGEPATDLEFQKLGIIDVSHNNFTGILPCKYIRNWNAMKSADSSRLSYLEAYTSFQAQNATWFRTHLYSVNIIVKGMERKYGSIVEFFAFVDLSSNEFEGEIPTCFEDLKILLFLNLSNNLFVGQIPSFLGDMIKLESLDLSHNQLSGEIPHQFVSLTFLAYFSISHNNLIGSIPQGGQLQSFPISSYEANQGLCGKPLPNECGSSRDLQPSPSTFEGKEEEQSVFDFGWKVVAIGYGCGAVAGFLLGNFIIARNLDWFLRTYGVGQTTRRWRMAGVVALIFHI